MNYIFNIAVWYSNMLYVFGSIHVQSLVSGTPLSSCRWCGTDVHLDFRPALQLKRINGVKLQFQSNNLYRFDGFT
jgi:hypothetical protein